ncbi:MAG: hypothetical protein ACE5HD_10660 [Acidobacteriota bacterium]
MTSATLEPQAATILVVNTGRADEPVPPDIVENDVAHLLRVDGDRALSLLRRDPFSVTAVILSGDGESPVTAAALQAIKGAAPRIPIVFLDEQLSTASERVIRQAGVHYYAHIPVNTTEIASVLTFLAADDNHRPVPMQTGLKP